MTIEDMKKDDSLDMDKVVSEPISEIEEDDDSDNNFPMSGVGDILRTQTGEGAIEDYLDHPLNFKESMGLAQIIRGATGFFGELKLALIDIVMGLLRWQHENKALEEVPVG